MPAPRANASDKIASTIVLNALPLDASAVRALMYGTKVTSSRPRPPRDPPRHKAMIAAAEARLAGRLHKRPWAAVIHTASKPSLRRFEALVGIDRRPCVA